MAPTEPDSPALEIAEATLWPERVADRVAEWWPRYVPRTAEEEWLLGQLAVHSLRLEDEQRIAGLISDAFAQRARMGWDEDRKCDAEELALKLARRPGAVAARLRRTKQGAKLLLDRWIALQNIFALNGSWTDAQSSMALDLLGVAPESRGPHPWENDPELAARIARREIHVLQLDIDGPLTVLDDFDRVVASEGQPIEPPRPLRAHRRAEAAAWRDYKWTRQLLLAGRSGPATALHPGTEPVTPAPLAVDDAPPHTDEPAATDPAEPIADDPPDEPDEAEAFEPEPPHPPQPQTAPTRPAPATDSRNRRARRAARKRQRAARQR